MSTHTSELVRLAELHNMADAVIDAGATIGAAIDSGLITLEQVLADVRRCNNRAELDGMLLALAADSALTTGTMGG